MLHVMSSWCVARDMHTIAPRPLERTCWRWFAVQWGDSKKSRSAPLKAITIILIIDVEWWQQFWCCFRFSQKKGSSLAYYQWSTSPTAWLVIGSTTWSSVRWPGQSSSSLSWSQSEHSQCPPVTAARRKALCTSASARMKRLSSVTHQTTASRSTTLRAACCGNSSHSRMQWAWPARWEAFSLACWGRF